jgi:hypothetical protein
MPGGGAGTELAQIDKSTGVMVSVAGTTGSGLADGDGPNAWFGSIEGLTTDGASIWVADGGPSQRLRDVTEGAALPGPADDPIAEASVTVDDDVRRGRFG